MNEHEDLIVRLRALGSQPVRPEVVGQHLAALRGPEAAGRRPWGHRLRVMAAFAVGLLAGTTGLATAGALPNGAQEVAHKTLGAVGVKVPHGDRYQGPECGGTFKNHGQYVRSQPKDKRAEAAASRCGKPIQAGSDADGAGDEGKAPGGDCQGPPPWAGKGKPDAGAKADWKQKCARGDDGDKEQDPPDQPPAAPDPAADRPPAAPDPATDQPPAAPDPAADQPPAAPDPAADQPPAVPDPPAGPAS